MKSTEAQEDEEEEGAVSMSKRQYPHTLRLEVESAVRATEERYEAKFREMKTEHAAVLAQVDGEMGWQLNGETLR